MLMVLLEIFLHLKQILIHSHRGRSSKPIFVQIAKQVVNLNPLELRLPSRAWKVKLVGEGADDAGGVFDDTITEMCQVIEDYTDLKSITNNELCTFCKVTQSNVFALGAAVWCGGPPHSYSQQLCRRGLQH